MSAVEVKVWKRASVISVLPSEIAQAVMVPTTLNSTELSRGCRQGAASG